MKVFYARLELALSAPELVYAHPASLPKVAANNLAVAEFLLAVAGVHSNPQDRWHATPANYAVTVAARESPLAVSTATLREAPGSESVPRSSGPILALLLLYGAHPNPDAKRGGALHVLAHNLQDQPAPAADKWFEVKVRRPSP